MIDKIFKIGLLLLGCGLIVAYIYVNAISPRYVVTVAGVGNLHVIYLVDTQKGTLYYTSPAIGTNRTAIEVAIDKFKKIPLEDK